MSFEDRAWRALERVARGLNQKPPRKLLSELKDEARRAGVHALDRLVSRLAGRPVSTTSLPPPPKPIPPPAAPPPEIPAAAPVIAAPPPIAAPTEEPAAPPPAPEPKGPEAPALDPIAVALAARPADASAPLPSLPERYGIDRVVLLAGESEWVFAYWEIDPDRLRALTSAVEPRAELRLVDEQGGLISRTQVDPLQGRQHLRIPELGHRYRAELISAHPGSEGVIISRSRAVIAARQGEQVATRTAESTLPARVEPDHLSSNELSAVP